MKNKIILFNKPFNVLSQFTDTDGRDTLSKYIDIKGYYCAGRLDRDSEGLLVLTCDGKLQAQIANPKYKKPKTYLAQVEGNISNKAIKYLKNGVSLKDGITLPANVKKIAEPKLWHRHPPVRYRETITDSWIKITIYEGRNRQVRRMLASVGFPCLRLVRVAIGDWQLQDLELGQYKII